MELSCNHCGQKLEIEDTGMGQPVHCPQCHSAIELSTGNAGAPQASAEGVAEQVPTIPGDVTFTSAKGPPPIPPVFRSPAQPQGDQSKTIFHQAARAAILAPLIAIGVNALTTSLRHGTDIDRTSLLIMGGLNMLLILSGLVFAVVALCGIPRYGKKGLLGRGIGGLVINGILIVLIVVGLATGIKRSIDRKDAWSEFTDAADDLRDRVAEQVNAEPGSTNNAVNQLGQFQSRIESAARNAQGKDALIMQASAAFTARLQDALKKFSKATDAYLQADVINIGKMTEPGQIVSRRAVVQDFLTANSSLTELVNSQQSLMEAELKARNLSPDDVEKFMIGFRQSQAPLLPTVNAIRACDNKVGLATLKILDIAEASWGKFRFDEEAQQTVFEEDQALNTYNEQIQVIQKAAEEQTRLQAELIELNRRAAGPSE